MAGSTHHQLHERELRGCQAGDLGRVGVAWDDVLVRLQERLPVKRLPVVVVLLILGARPVALLCSTGSSSGTGVRACTRSSAFRLAGRVPSCAAQSPQRHLSSPWRPCCAWPHSGAWLSSCQTAHSHETTFDSQILHQGERQRTSELTPLRWDDVFDVGGEGLRVPAADCLLALRNCRRPVGPPGELPGLHAH